MEGASALNAYISSAEDVTDPSSIAKYHSLTAFVQNGWEVGRSQARVEVAQHSLDNGYS